MRDGCRGSREAGMHCYTHLNTRSCGGDTTCHTEMNDHSSRLRLRTAADRKVQHEIPEDYMAFQQSNALPCSSFSCTHRASEETLGRSLCPAWGWVPGSTAWERRKGQMNEMQPGLVRFGWRCINSSIYLCIKIFINHTLQFQQRNSPKMSWFHGLN